MSSTLPSEASRTVNLLFVYFSRKLTALSYEAYTE